MAIRMNRYDDPTPTIYDPARDYKTATAPVDLDYHIELQKELSQQKANRAVDGYPNFQSAGTPYPTGDVYKVAPPPLGLVSEAAIIREQVEKAQQLTGFIRQHLLEPEPCGTCGEAKDNPYTIEGILYATTHKLSSLILDLENLVQKIGGR